MRILKKSSFFRCQAASLAAVSITYRRINFTTYKIAHRRNTLGNTTTLPNPEGQQSLGVPEESAQGLTLSDVKVQNGGSDMMAGYQNGDKNIIPSTCEKTVALPGWCIHSCVSQSAKPHTHTQRKRRGSQRTPLNSPRPP